jgi:hypothetical protein
VKERSYRAPLTRLLPVFAVLGMITLFAPIVVVALSRDPLLVLWLVGVGFCWYWMAYRTAYGVRLVGEDATFRSVLRRWTVPLHRVRRVQARRNLVRIRWDGGTVDLFPVEDLDRLADQIRTANPNVELVGL